MRAQPPDISVVICSHTLDRWNGLVAAVSSVRRQTYPPKQLVVVVDHNPSLLSRARDEFPELTVVSNDNPAGISGARNTGLALATSEIIAYLDDDAIAEPTWLEGLIAGYATDKVLGVMGFIAPLWESERPGWFPEEFDWIIGCTYRGMTEGTEIRNLFGADSFRRDILAEAGGFSHELGRTSTQALGDEETGACIRARQLYPEGVFVFVCGARVDHRVPSSRTTWRYFRQRCYGEGISKANLVRLVGSSDGLSSERRYALVTLPTGVGRALVATLRGDRDGLARAAALVAGLVITATGYLVGRLTLFAQSAQSRPGVVLSATQSDRPANPAEPQSTGEAPAGRLRLLMVTPRYFPFVGGVEQHVAHVARLLARMLPM